MRSAFVLADSRPPLPPQAHHLPRLLLHPSRRLRLSAHTLHAQFTTPTPASSTRYSPLLAATRAALLLPQWVESAEYVASWAMGPFDGDRQVRTVAKRSWEAAVKAGEVAAEQQQQQEAGQQGEQQGHEGINLLEHAEPIFKFAASLILAPPPTPSGPSEAAVADAAASAEADQAALKTQALLLLSSLLAVLPSPLPLSDEALDLLSSEELWDHADPEWQPSKGLRRALYELLGAAVGRKGEKLLEREETVAIVAQRVLRLCWGEDEGWAGVIAFLRREYG